MLYTTVVTPYTPTLATISYNAVRVVIPARHSIALYLGLYNYLASSNVTFKKNTAPFVLSRILAGSKRYRKTCDDKIADSKPATVYPGHDKK